MVAGVGGHVGTAWIGAQSGGYDCRAIQEWSGQSDVKTTMVYTHVLNRGGHGVQSPIDRM